MGLTIRRRKGSKNYQIRGTVDGVFVEESAGTADKRAAQLKASARELEIVRGHVVGRGTSATFLEVAVSYLETVSGSQSRAVGKLLNHFQTTPLGQIDQGAAEACVLALYPKVANETVRRQCLGPLQSVLNHAAATIKGYAAPQLDKSKWPGSAQRTRWLTPEEWDAFTAHADPDLAAFATVTLQVGSRISETLGLDRTRDLNLADRLGYFRDDKNGEDRQFHIPEAAFIAIANLRAAPLLTVAGEVVPPSERRRVFWMYRRPKDVYAAWHPVRIAAGLGDDVTPHVLCHTFATWMVEYGDANAKDLLETKRWKSLASVMRYLHAPEHRVRSKIDAAFGQYPVSRKKKASKQ